MMAAVQARCATATCDVRQTVTVSNTAWDKFQLREGLVQELFPDLSLQGEGGGDGCPQRVRVLLCPMLG